ncbi:MAG: tRNA lysidine(34) synthetase TilS [candidate division KSB1 bacterium]|nr:tRNA lysidine(34) synthetase TilS [candidate division KSB1 bacterium]
MLRERFEKTLTEHALVAPEQRVVVAVSGGVDSMVLLDLFAAIRSRWRLALVVAHLNHGLRGEEADQDEAFVRRRAEDYRVPVVVERADVAAFAREHRLSREAAARQVRYAFLQRVALQVRADRVALGHQADDQAETFLDHLLRGAGLAGLGGMWWRREIFVRPLLAFRRSELVEYAQLHQLPFCQDSTNLDRSIRRNRLRHELIPLLASDYNPRVVDSLTRACQAIQEADEALRTLAREQLMKDARREGGKIVLDITAYLRYLSVLQKYVLLAAVEELGVCRSRLSSRQIERVTTLVRTKRPGTRVTLGGGLEARISGKYLVLGPVRPETYLVAVEVGKAVQDEERGFRFRCAPATWEEYRTCGGKSRAVEFVDAARIQGALRLRSWQQGDRFVPLGMNDRKKVSDFFVDAKVPGHRRPCIPLLECDAGIVWVCGLRLDERFRVTPQTTDLLKLEFHTDYGRQE